MICSKNLVLHFIIINTMKTNIIKLNHSKVNNIKILYGIFSVLLLLPLIIDITFFSKIIFIFCYLFILTLFFIIPFILFNICFKHDKKIYLKIDENKNISYFHSNIKIYKFSLESIESVTIYSAPRYFHEFYSINLKNNINVYISYLSNIELLYILKPDIPITQTQCILFEELWNPIYKVENQLRLLNNKDL